MVALGDDGVDAGVDDCVDDGVDDALHARTPPPNPLPSCAPPGRHAATARGLGGSVLAGASPGRRRRLRLQPPRG